MRFYFDYLFYLQRTTILNLGQAKYDDFLGQCYTKALEQGKRITALSKFKAQLEFEKLTPATAYPKQLSAMSIVLLKMNEALEFYKKLKLTKPTGPIKACARNAGIWSTHWNFRILLRSFVSCV